MNLRIKPEQIRFRVSEQEFLRLCTKEVLKGATTLAQNVQLVYSVAAHANPLGADGQLLSLDAFIHAGQVSLALTVFADGVAQLQQSGVQHIQKEGIQSYFSFVNGEMLACALEIDLLRKK